MSEWTSSGSRRSDIAVNPETSVNMTVTCLRSPSRAVREVRIFSARWWGVYAAGDAKRSPGSMLAGSAAPAEGAATPATGGGEVAAAVSLAPHSPQNLFVAGETALQLGHVIASREPHSPQNRCPSGFSCWH